MNNQETLKKPLSLEKNLFVYESRNEVAKIVSSKIFDQILLNRKTNLGLSVGKSLDEVYHYLSTNWKSKNVSFKKVSTFNLEEYLNFNNWNNSMFSHMNQNLFKNIDIKTENINFPNKINNKNIETNNPQKFGSKILKSKELSIMLLDVSQNGALGFNQPTVDPDSINNTTHVAVLDETTKDLCSHYFVEEKVPNQGITMGLLEILNFNKIILLAFGKDKVQVLKKLFTAKDFSPLWPVTALIYAKSEVEVYTDDDTFKLFEEELKKIG